MVTVNDDGCVSMNQALVRALDVARALEAVLCERRDLLSRLATVAEAPQTPTTVMEQITLQ
ncbi:MAG TPA: hypothetical protein VGW38_20025, partial [Chloroflexota bacterium]|nr:hypothetical protein [Chloroflexota bacterium]